MGMADQPEPLTERTTSDIILKLSLWKGFGRYQLKSDRKRTNVNFEASWWVYLRETAGHLAGCLSGLNGEFDPGSG